MTSYFALHGRDNFGGGYMACVHWAREQVLAGSGLVKIVKARLGEVNAVVMAEVSSDGIRIVSGASVVPLSRLRLYGT